MRLARFFGERAKDISGRVASLGWVLACCYLYFSTPSATLLSLSGFLFVVGGNMAAVVVFPALVRELQKLIGRVLAPWLPPPGGAVPGWLALLAWALLLAEGVAVFLTASWVFGVTIGA